MQIPARTTSSSVSSTAQPTQTQGQPDLMNQLHQFARNCRTRCPSLDELRQTGGQVIRYIAPHFFLMCGIGFTGWGIVEHVRGNDVESAACLLTASSALYTWLHQDDI